VQRTEASEKVVGLYIGAIITVPSKARFQRGPGQTNEPGANLPAIAHWHVLGKSVLGRVIERLQVFGVGEISILSEQAQGISSPAANTFWDSWEGVVSRFLHLGIESLLLLRVGPYIELDITEFLRFHRETSSAMTQVYDPSGALDLVAIHADLLRDGDGSFRSRLRGIIPHHQRYEFGGYCNRLSSASDYWQLVKDALEGRAAIRPVGTEVARNVWIGEGARVESSAHISAPAYLGQNSRVGAGCTLTGFTSIEEQCVLDCGTTVSDSCVLPGSYVGAGLKVREGVVMQEFFFNVRRNVQVQFSDRRLFGKTSRVRGMLRNTWAAGSRLNRQPSLQ
jgi:hypothetical protein